MRVVLGLVVVGSGVLLGACDNDDEPAADESMPAFVTTTVVATTIAPTTTQPRFYEVKAGDTLSAIAGTTGLPVEAIMQANNITDPNMIQAGQVLVLPLMTDISTSTSSTTAPVTTTPQPTAAPVFTTLAP